MGQHGKQGAIRTIATDPASARMRINPPAGKAGPTTTSVLRGVAPAAAIDRR